MVVFNLRFGSCASAGAKIRSLHWDALLSWFYSQRNCGVWAAKLTVSVESAMTTARMQSVHKGRELNIATHSLVAKVSVHLC
eukprot:457481-Pleurochrysis_carterae.AAC.2